MTKPKRTDKARLDWIEEGAWILFQAGDKWGINEDDEAGIGKYPTARAAIDAAMKAEAKEKRHAKG